MGKSRVERARANPRAESAREEQTGHPAADEARSPSQAGVDPAVSLVSIPVRALGAGGTVQRLIRIGSEEHTSNHSTYTKIDLIARLESHFGDDSPRRGWKHHVWSLAKNGEHQFANLGELATRLFQIFPQAGDKQDKEDPAFRAAISTAAPVGSTKPEKQAAGLHAIATQGTHAEKAALGQMLQEGRNRRGLVENVRKGGLNETLLSKHTPEAAERSLGMVPGVQATAPTVDGGQQSWVGYQERTSGPTRNFTFPGTTGDPGKKIQDTHINSSTYRLDPSGKKHATVGETSRLYHHGPGRSLEANFNKSTTLRGLSARNVKFHQGVLATREQVLGVPAADRADQIYETSKGKQLHLNQDKDLDEFADIVEVHRAKELTRQKRTHEGLLKVDGEVSESEPDFDGFDELDSDADTEAEVEERAKKRMAFSDKADKPTSKKPGEQEDGPK